MSRARPVVEEREAEHVLFGIGDRHRLAERVAGGRRRRRARARSRGAGSGRAPAPRRRRLESGPCGRAERAVPADADRRGAAVVADRHPLVVRQQRVVGAELLADRGRVVDAGVEVGVVADRGTARPSRRSACGTQRGAAVASARRCHARRPGRDAPGAARAAARRLERPSAGSCRRCRSAPRGAGRGPGRRSRRRCARLRVVPARRKRPNGRFWIGKSLAGSLADSTQLRSAGSCVCRSRRSWLPRVEVLLQALPAAVVVVLQLRRLERVRGSAASTKRVSNMKAIVSLDDVAASTGRRGSPSRRSRRRGRGRSCCCAGSRRRARSPRPWRRRRRAPGP